MNCEKAKKAFQVNITKAVCPIGEMTGKKNIGESKIPVPSCEGACIRGDWAINSLENISVGSGASPIQAESQRGRCCGRRIQ